MKGLSSSDTDVWVQVFLSRALGQQKSLLSGPIGGKSGGSEMKVKQKSLCKKERENDEDDDMRIMC